MKRICVALVVMLSLDVSIALADGHSPESAIDNRCTVFGGIEFYQANGDFSSTSAGKPEVSVDMKDLGLDRNAVSPICGAIIRVGKRWDLRLDYFGYHDDASKTADAAFDYEDVSIPIGALTDSNLDLDIYAANVSYTIVHSKKSRFGVGLGVHAVDISTGHIRQGNGGRTRDFFGRRQGGLPRTTFPTSMFPAPYAFSKRAVMRYGGGWMSMSYAEYDGALLFAKAMLEYWVHENIGIGVGYRYVKADFEYDPGRWKEKYDAKLPGPLVYLVFGF